MRSFFESSRKLTKGVEDDTVFSFDESSRRHSYRPDCVFERDSDPIAKPG